MVCGPGGRRSIKCTEFTTGIFETTLAADEVIESIRIAKLSANARWGYLKLCRKAGEFASALAVVIADRMRGHSRVVLGAANGAPLVLHETSRLVSEGGRGDISRTVAADLDRAADRHFDEFQCNLHMVAVRRAAQQALQ
jgi:carbon-monoxide dehydrogenase medium subunit